MSLAQRLAWLDGVSTLAVLATAIAVWSPATDDPVGSLWRLAARVGIVAAVCLGAFYYNDLYAFEAPHDAGQLFTPLCRPLGHARPARQPAGLRAVVMPVPRRARRGRHGGVRALHAAAGRGIAHAERADLRRRFPRLARAARAQARDVGRHRQHRPRGHGAAD